MGWHHFALRQLFRSAPTAKSVSSYSWLRRPAPRWLYVADYENVLGTSFEIESAAEAASLRKVDRLSKILVGFEASREFSRWLRAGQKPVAVSAVLCWRRCGVSWPHVRTSPQRGSSRKRAASPRTLVRRA